MKFYNAKIKPMRTQKNLKLHKKATGILELIDRCDFIIEDCRVYLNKTNNAPWFAFIRPQYEKQLTRYSAIKMRLIDYYYDVMKRLIEPQINNAVETGTIIINENGLAEAL